MGTQRAICVVLFGCFFICNNAQAQAQDPGRITNYEPKSSASPAGAVGCTNISNLSNLYSPAELYPAVRKCIDKRDYDGAAKLFSMAGAYGYFDSMRVDFESASHAVRYVQILSFQDVAKRKMKNFNNHLARDYAAGTSSHTLLCQQLRQIGPPAYYPEYMVQHSMRFGLSSTSSAMRVGFDAEQAWQQTLTHYLRCLAVN